MESLQELQREFDILEDMDVVKPPEEMGVVVQHASPSLLIKEGPEKRRLVTTFNDFSPYIRIPPTASSDCNTVLRRVS